MKKHIVWLKERLKGLHLLEDIIYSIIKLYEQNAAVCWLTLMELQEGESISIINVKNAEKILVNVH